MLKKNLIFIAIFFFGCKSKKTLTFEQRYAEADKLYERKKFSKAAAIYDELYPQVPWKKTSVDILKKLADCKFQEKDFIHCYPEYKKLYETIFDEDRLSNGYRMCVCLLNMTTKNNKKDISLAETLLEEIAIIEEEYEDCTDEAELQILEEIHSLKEQALTKVIEKHFNIIKTYENLELYDSAVVYAKNFLFKYSNSKMSEQVAQMLLKNLFCAAKELDEKKKKSEEQQNALFERWKEIILTFDNYKEVLEGDKGSVEIYEQALKQIKVG